MSNFNNMKTLKAQTLVEVFDLCAALDRKLALLDAADRQDNFDGAYDLLDQVTSMEHSVKRLRDAARRANTVNGVEAEYDNLFGEEA
jgi:hypothetical protein